MKRSLFTQLIALLVSCTMTCHAQLTTANSKNASLDISVEVQTNPTPISLSIDQTDLIRTRADGFVIGAANPYRKIGTVNITWQPNDLYEIRVYTNNIENFGLGTWIIFQGLENVLNVYTGMHLCNLGDNDLTRSSFIPFKVCSTPIGEEANAHVNTDGTIYRQYFTATEDKDESNIVYSVVPEKLAMTAPESYKVVVASTFDGIYPYSADLTFAVDVASKGFTNNQSQGYSPKYEARIIIDMVSN